MKIRLFLLLILLSAGCQNDHSSVQREENEARREIGAAEQNVRKTEANSDARIAEASSSGKVENVEEEKIRATEKLADAKEDLGDEKAEATKEIAKAKEKAGESEGSYKHE